MNMSHVDPAQQLGEHHQRSAGRRGVATGKERSGAGQDEAAEMSGGGEWRPSAYCQGVTRIGDTAQRAERRHQHLPNGGPIVSCLLQTLPPREAPARRGRGSKPAAAVVSARSDRAGRRTSTTHGGRRRARTARLTSEASASDDWRAGPAPPTCDARSLSAGREREGWPGRRGREGEDILAQGFGGQREHQQRL